MHIENSDYCFNVVSAIRFTLAMTTLTFSRSVTVQNADEAHICTGCG